MNDNDPFEQRLRRHPPRQVPSAWRKEILAAADATRRSTATQSMSEDQAALLGGWRLIFARVPLAWASLAVLWIALLGVNLTLPRPAVGVTVQTPASVRMGNWASLAALTAELDAAQEPLASTPDAAPASKPTGIPHRPRSERWRGFDFGEAGPDFRFDHVA